jgi:alpha-tubulin suppressor-like RCC1 family protein
MFWPLRSAPARWFATVLTVLSLSTVAAGPAVAAKAPAHTAISAHLTASTVLVHSTAAVSGTVSPAGGSVVLERLVGTKWQPVAHQKPSRAGAFSFSVRAPKAAATWSLKVIRASSSTAKAGTSATLHLHAVTKQFAVAAASASTVTAPGASTVTGVVIPAASGTVQVQRQDGKSWITVATGKLGAGGVFSVSTTLPVGTQRLRVVKPYTSSIAQGTSTSFTVTVSVLAQPTVTTAALPAARVGVPYASELTATGGNGFYQWSGSGLPGGLTLSPAGLLAGTPTSQGTTSLKVTVTDGAGHSGSTTLSLTTAPPAGQLFAAGTNDDGELGNGTNIGSNLAVPVGGLTSVVAAASDGESEIALTSDGSVWTWGDNQYGQLGNGNTNASLVPLRVPNLAGVTAVAAEANTFLALKSDGTVWAWGQGDVGALGDGQQSDKSSPAQISALSSVVAIGGTQGAGFALRSDGTVWSWGSNNGSALLGNGTLGSDILPTPIPGLTNITAIAIGGLSGYALQKGGAVFDWGDNTYGELGNGTMNLQTTPVAVPNLPPIAQIAAGVFSGYALATSGTIYSWGANSDKQLGNNGTTVSAVPVQVRNLVGARAVGAFGFTGFAIASDGTVAAWGDNDEGRLGTGTAVAQGLPVTMVGISGAIGLGSGSFGTISLVIVR